VALPIGDTVADFEADTTEGRIRFHEWIGDGWAVLFSHPKDFTPVSTTELGYMAGLKPEFEKRHCKVIGLSIDSVDDHVSWSEDIAETQGHAPNYPISGGRKAIRHDPSERNRRSEQGEDVIIVPALCDEEANAKFPDGWKAPKPYLRIVKQPS